MNIVQLIIIAVVAAGLVSLLIKSVYNTIESRKRYTCGACGYQGLRNYQVCPHCQNLEEYSQNAKWNHDDPDFRRPGGPSASDLMPVRRRQKTTGKLD